MLDTTHTQTCQCTVLYPTTPRPTLCICTLHLHLHLHRSSTSIPKPGIQLDAASAFASARTQPAENGCFWWVLCSLSRLSCLVLSCLVCLSSLHPSLARSYLPILPAVLVGTQCGRHSDSAGLLPLDFLDFWDWDWDWDWEGREGGQRGGSVTFSRQHFQLDGTPGMDDTVHSACDLQRPPTLSCPASR